MGGWLHKLWYHGIPYTTVRKNEETVCDMEIHLRYMLMEKSKKQDNTVCYNLGKHYIRIHNTKEKKYI